MNGPLRKIALGLCRLVAAAATVAQFALPVHAEDGPIQLKILGGLASVGQHTKLEVPFWVRDVPKLTQGRVQADIHPFDQSGLSGKEMLQLISLGVAPFGTALLAMVSADEPELNAVDLPMLNPDMPTLRRTVGLYRNHIRQLLEQKYGIELLGPYIYPAQVIYCTQPFRTLNDLTGFRVRTSSISQSEMMSALGAIPVVTPFSDIVTAIRNHVVDCAITGTMSGNQIGLPTVTNYIYPMAISWGVSFFGANAAAWSRLPPDIRDILRRGIEELERSIWNAADLETASGLACDIGEPACVGGNMFHMKLVAVTAEYESQRSKLLVESILPHWVQRCGTNCMDAWNETLGAALAMRVGAD
jgi:TRAP-type C4-dicarboxylate transport system substrate-binding protein